MHGPTDDPLDRSLAAWKTPPVPADLEAEVWRRIEAERRPQPVRWRWFRQPAFLGMAAVCGLLLVLLLGETQALRTEKLHNRQLAQTYLRMIDPSLDLPAVGNIDAQVDWMKSELGLTDAQYTRIRNLHAASIAQLQHYAARRQVLRQNDQAIEQKWKSENLVDFLAVADLRDEQRTLDAAWKNSVHQLVAETGAVLNSRQKDHYLRILEPVSIRPDQQPRG